MAILADHFARVRSTLLTMYDESVGCDKTLSDSRV